MIWNRQRFIKDPATGKRVTRLNEQKDWVTQELPELRIVDQALWDAAKQRQEALNRRPAALWQTNRPQYLLSGLTKCGVCGGSYSKVNSTRYGCSAAKNKGSAVCDNRSTIKRETLEGYVLGALETHLMRSELIEVFCAEYTKHLSSLHAQQNAHRRSLEAERQTLLKERDRLIQAIKDGIPAAMIKDDLDGIAKRIEKAEKTLLVQPALKPLIHPSMASRYHKAVTDLKMALTHEESRPEANEHIRGLIDKIVLTPKKRSKGLNIDLHGDLAEILTLATEKEDMKKEIERIFDDPRLNCLNFKQKSQTLQKIGSGGWI